MEHKINVGTTVSQLKDSLDYLQSSIGDDYQSPEALIRLSRALKDIDEEVNMLRTYMKVCHDQNSY